MTESFLKIPRLNATEAQALTTLAHQGAGIAVPGWNQADPKPCILNFSVVPTGQASPLVGDLIRLSFTWAGSKLWLDLPRQVGAAWLGQVLGTETVHLVNLAPPWVKLLQQTASDWLVHRLSQAGRGSAQCLGWQDQPESAPAGARHCLLLSLQFPVREEGWPETVYATLHTDGLGLLLVAGLVAQHPGQATSTSAAANLPIRMAICLGETWLPLQDAEALAPGQVVLLQRRFAQGAQSFQLRTESARGGGLCCLGRLENHCLNILSKAQTMTAETPSVLSDGQDEEVISLAQIPVRLSFDLGELEMTLDQVKALQPGQTMELSKPVQEYVTIRANGMPIGTGQLVEIDGRLGVCVGRMASIKPSTNGES